MNINNEFHKYLFKDTNNGHYYGYCAFLTYEKLSQEEADRLMRKSGGNGRTGGNIKHLLKSAVDEGFFIFYLPNIYGKDKEACERYSLIKLPDKFEDWEIIEGISGNY